MRLQTRLLMTTAIVGGLTLSSDAVVAQQVINVGNCCQIVGSPQQGRVAAPMAATPIVQQQVVYRDIQRQAYRQQAYLENVPVTRVRRVAVDRGSYQTVWVPKVVLQDVAETRYEPQLKYRTVAVPVTQRVAEVRPLLTGCPPVATTVPTMRLPSTNAGQGVVLLAPEPWVSDANAQIGVMPTLTIPSASRRLATDNLGSRQRSNAGWQTIPQGAYSLQGASLPRMGDYRVAADKPVAHAKRHTRSAMGLRSATNVARVRRAVH